MACEYQAKAVVDLTTPSRLCGRPLLTLLDVALVERNRITTCHVWFMLATLPLLLVGPLTVDTVSAIEFFIATLLLHQATPSLLARGPNDLPILEVVVAIVRFPGQRGQRGRRGRLAAEALGRATCAHVAAFLHHCVVCPVACTGLRSIVRLQPLDAGGACRIPAVVPTLLVAAFFGRVGATYGIMFAAPCLLLLRPSGFEIMGPCAAIEALIRRFCSGLCALLARGTTFLRVRATPRDFHL
mmetsp:Transcript_90471/g.230085  ORF Transcript_90471/g.230085 Transcript_90471/m.230085 type:complete len:242 (-) Transcript_90471:843-1568(-)